MPFPAAHTSTGPKFTMDRVASDLIHKIAERAVALPGFQRTKTTKLDITMDLSATHANGTPLNLDKLLAFDDFNFAHDLYGIYRHLDRDTGELMDCFMPRCSI